MKILVHALAALETGGSDRHLRGMLASLETAEPSAEYILYVSTAFPIQQTPKTVSVIVKTTASRPWFAPATEA